jgi:transcriptional regulator with XRE-family HTH domain
MSLRERTRPGPGIIVARNLALKPPISGAQLRAARALLKLSVRELSDQCGISQSAIARSEQVDGTPPMQLQNLAAIRRIFEDRGIEFLGLDGVRLLTISHHPKRQR